MNVELSHVGELCGFDAFLAKYQLDDPALKQLAAIVRDADASRLDLTPQSAGLYAPRSGGLRRAVRVVPRVPVGGARLAAGHGLIN